MEINTTITNIKLKKYLTAAAVGLCTQGALAYDKLFQNEFTPGYLPEGHAPAGVMSDHLHRQGEWMLGYRLQRTDYSSLYRGSKKSDAMALSMAGYSVMPSKMRMEMQMLDIMYGWSNNLTLILMPQTMQMDMIMTAIDGGHGGHEHSVSGVGDTIFGGLVRLADNQGYRLHATLAASAPTGSVAEKNADGSFMPYGMQLGTGTWDLLPSLTYSSAREQLSWGAQLSARLPLEEKNESGYQVGEKFSVTAWSAYRVVDWASVSLRLDYSKEGDINGHYNGPHNHSSPAELQPNYGGELINAAVGANFVVQGGVFAGVRLGVEWVSSLSADYNGFQLAQDDGLNMSLSYSF